MLSGTAHHGLRSILDTTSARLVGHDVGVAVAPERFWEAAAADRVAEDVAPRPALGSTATPVGSLWQRCVKRTIDLVVGGLALLVLAPVLVVCLVAIRIDSSGPGLFRQRRVGRDGQPFTIFKLRTMTDDAEARRSELLHLNEADGPLFKITDDPRITRVGRVLRKLSLDELPQLLNVLRGDMSLVGPRPALPCEVEAWDDELHARLRVRPGITGAWQVNGRSDCSFEEYVRHDLGYVDAWCISTDLAILVRTVPLVVLGRGAR